MTLDALTRPCTDYRDIERLLLSRVREDPRPYAARGAIAGKAVRALLARVGDPQQDLRFLHVAGSKGKGSVALLAECLLRAAGEAVGTYTSPHLQRWNERIRVHGEAVDDTTLAAALETLRPHVAALDALGDALAPSFFDLVTAAGLLVFARSHCRVVVLEVGLGGLYDATNVVTPAACCISSIELEHTDKLGPTLADIAAHKAGIIKSGAPVVTAVLPAPAQAVVAARCAAVATRELRLDRDWWLESQPGPPGARQVQYREAQAAGGYRCEFRLRHPAAHMAVNAGLAIALVRAAGYSAPAHALADCRLPGRAQVLRERPWIVIDGAHTPASLAALACTLDAIPAARRRFLISATHGKSLTALAALVDGCDALIVTRADALRSAPPAATARELAALAPHVTPRVMEEPRAALAALQEALDEDCVLCVCGSMYLAGIALGVLDAAHGRPA